MKPLVFLPHIHEEAEVANWLQQTLKRVFADAVNLLLISDRSMFVGEDRWLNKMEMALKDAAVVLVPCDSNSIHHPWTSFLAGGAWMASKRVVLLCHGGLLQKELPQPLASLQAYNLTNPDDFRNVIKLISFTACVMAQGFDPQGALSSLPVVQGKVQPPQEAPLPQQKRAVEQDVTAQHLQTLRSHYQFDKRSGVHRHNINGLCICTSCLLEGVESPLTEYEVGWQCNRKGCEKFYSNPDFPSIATEDMDYDPFNR